MRCPDQKLRKHLCLLLVTLGLLLVQAGCSRGAIPGPSILVIAVDKLGMGFNVCPQESDDTAGAGLGEICRQGVRFTHAYTTSTLSVPALGSVLTGRYPYQMGLRHNGGGELGGLSSDVLTLAEYGFKSGYRTFFASGGAPILSRTGLSQGFEVFDDNIRPTPYRLHRPAKEVINVFQKWLEGRLRLDNRTSGPAISDRFIAVLHFADLQMPWSPAVDEAGRMRENSTRAQLDEIDDNLGRLWQYLKRHRLWDSTMIVVVGLQGAAGNSRIDEIPALSLQSDMTHVTLLIKDVARQETEKHSPPGQPHYAWAPRSTSFDVNVSLADVGLTLFERISGEKEPTHPHLERDGVRSLLPTLGGPGDYIEEWRRSDRLILTESAWAKWIIDASLPIRVAIRRGPYLYLHDQSHPASSGIYNTVTDAFEVSPLPPKDQKTKSLIDEFSTIANSLGFEEFPRITTSQLIKDRWGRSFFSQRMGARIGEYSPILSSDQRYVQHKADEGDVTLRTWLELQGWTVGSLIPKADACTELMLAPKIAALPIQKYDSEIVKQCRFRGAREAGQWFHTTDYNEKSRLLDQIVRADWQRLLSVRVAETSFALGHIWEVGSVRQQGLDSLEVLLAQPEAAKLRVQIMRRLRSRPEP